ncbi:MAG: SDR family oxidoreductase [Steroidobacteraceae bacterium]
MANGSVNMVLVLGSNGKTGSRIVERLRAAGKEVRLGSRSATPRFDWNDRTTWPAILDGIGAAYVAYQPDLCVPGAVDSVAAFYDAAAKAGVRKIVLLSGRGEPEAEQAEKALQGTSLDWTIIRASWFFQNFSENYFLDEIRAGSMTLPDGLAAEPFVDVEDIAEIAVLALTGNRHNRQLYEVTGPEAITFADAVALIGLATGREIQFQTVPMSVYRQALLEAQLPGELVDLVTYLFTTVLDGRNTPLADGVQRALGRSPMKFSDYVERTAATGVWEVK